MNTVLSIKQVFNFDHGLCGPFTIDLDGNMRIEVERVLRYLPGKRLACQALWKGKKVFAKIFYGAGNGSSYFREQQGYALLKQNRLNTASR